MGRTVRLLGGGFMSLLLDTVRAERDKLLAPLRDKLNLLDELERLATRLDGDGEDAGRDIAPSTDAGVLPAAAEKRAAKEKKRARTGKRSPGRNNGGKAPANAGAQAGSAPSGAGSASSHRGPEGVRWALEQRSPLTSAQIAALVGLTENTVAQTVGQMLRDGQLVATGTAPRPGGTNGRRPRLVALPGQRDHQEAQRPHGASSGVNGNLQTLKQRVLDAITDDPAALNEDRLALALNVDREDIAVATGGLLIDDQVILMPDGSYRPGFVGAAA
jgi:hypothetical protein